MIEKEFGKYIQRERVLHNLSLRDLAKILGKSAQYISEVENGKKYAFCLSDCKKLAKAFNLSEWDVNHTLAPLAEVNWHGLLDEKMK